MKTEKQIKNKIEAIRNDIPKFTKDAYMSDKLWTKLEILKWVLEDTENE